MIGIMNVVGCYVCVQDGEDILWSPGMGKNDLHKVHCRKLDFVSKTRVGDIWKGCL